MQCTLNNNINSAVRYLEEQNQLLEKKIRDASARKEVDLGAEKREALRKLRAQIDDAAVSKVKAEMARDNLRGEASELKWKWVLVTLRNRESVHVATIYLSKITHSLHKTSLSKQLTSSMYYTRVVYAVHVL